MNAETIPPAPINLVAELRSQRDDALKLVLERDRIIADCRRVLASRDKLIGQLVAELVDARLRIFDLEWLRDLNTRALERLRVAVHGGRAAS